MEVTKRHVRESAHGRIRVFADKCAPDFTFFKTSLNHAGEFSDHKNFLAFSCLTSANIYMTSPRYYGYAAILLLPLLFACSNSDSGNAATNSKTASMVISYQGSPFSYYRNAAMTTLSPSVTGETPTSCSSSPALPAGLTIAATTCAISGTPTTAQAATDYTITASNSSSNATTTINITIANPGVPTISYSGSPYILVMGQAMTSLTPTLNLAGGTVTACSSSPALPTGISIDNTTCVLSGTPSGSVNATTYTISVTTVGGTGTASINILTGKRIFVTASTYNGNLGGISGADTKCNADANKPATGTYKAYIADGTNRRVCSTGWCTDTTEQIDWVTTIGRNYIRADQSALIGQAAFNGLLSSMSNGIGTTANAIWVGLALNYQAGSTCNSWTSSSAAASASAGNSQSTGNPHFNDTATTCNTINRLYCVEQ